MSWSGQSRSPKQRPVTAAAATATQADAMPLTHTALVGTVLTPTGPRAYVHLGQGRIRRVETGDILDGARISAIENGALILKRASDTRRLILPPS